MPLNGCVPGDTKVLFEVLLCGENESPTKDRAPGRVPQLRCAPLDLEFAEDLPIVSLYRVHGEEEPLTNFMV